MTQVELAEAVLAGIRAGQGAQRRHVEVMYIEGDRAYAIISENPYREHEHHISFRGTGPQVKSELPPPPYETAEA